ncbi:MAG TPA: HAD-IIA family hydrolase [Thermoleophilia bacterium]|nr:HAD-IIA family hydrolase [Thermoleophilia bacterium]
MRMVRGLATEGGTDIGSIYDETSDPEVVVPGIVMVAFDIDGVILRGGTLLPGASRAVQDVLDRGLSLRFVTNNSTRHRSEVAAGLADLGLPVQADMVLTSAAATAAWLAARIPRGARVLVVGGAGLVRELYEAGLDAVPACAASAAAAAPAASAAPATTAATEPWFPGAAVPATAAEVPAPPPPAVALSPDVSPAAVVVGLDVGFDYRTLATAQRALLAGALFVATNTDATFPVEGRLLPGAGTIVAAVATAAGRKPVVIGKPEPGLADALVAEAGGLPGAILFVGDKLSTDVEMASRAGMRSALVLTGVTARWEVDAAEAPRPDFVLETLEELPAVLARLGAGPVLR